jgi:hypothetical protein
VYIEYYVDLGLRVYGLTLPWTMIGCCHMGLVLGSWVGVGIGLVFVGFNIHCAGLRLSLIKLNGF